MATLNIITTGMRDAAPKIDENFQQIESTLTEKKAINYKGFAGSTFAFSRVGNLVFWRVFSPVDAGGLGQGTSFKWGAAIPAGYRPASTITNLVTPVSGSSTALNFVLNFNTDGSMSYNGKGCAGGVYLAGSGSYLTDDTMPG